jgi:hypothetical protein
VVRQRSIDGNHRHHAQACWAQGSRTAQDPFGEYDVSTCVVVTRDELIAELKRDFEWTDERIAQEPTLRHQRFYFWPAVCGWAGLPDDGNAD